MIGHTRQFILRPNADAGAGRLAGPAPVPRCRCGVARALALAVLLLAGLATGGCATYSARHADLRPALAEGRLADALADVEQGRKGKDLLLYHLERGLLLHYDDRWQQSNEAFQRAEDLAADLYTKSISEGALSLLTSDEVISYRADPFELALVPYYRALNYAYLGQPAEAAVEARKASLFLREYTDLDASLSPAAAGEEQTATAGGSCEQLAASGFLHYFAGLIYEWNGEINDAFIAYRNAATVYEAAPAGLAITTPPWLGEDLRRTGDLLGFQEELEQLAAAHPDLFTGQTGAPGVADTTGQVVVLLEIGFVDRKVQQELNVPILKEDSRSDVADWAESLALRTRPGWSSGERKIEYWLRVAMPELVAEVSPISRARVSAPVIGGHGLALPVEDIAGRARLTFAAEQPAVLLKTLARGLTKYLAKQKADDKGKVTGILANVFGAATESADTRSWLTLPEKILMARLSLPPGRYDLRVQLTDARGRPLREETLDGVTVEEGRWRFLSRRVF
jgi:hypothetical protein